MIPNTLCDDESTVIPWWYRLVSSRIGLNISTPSMSTISSGRSSMSPLLTRTAPTANAAAAPIAMKKIDAPLVAPFAATTPIVLR